MTEEQTPAPSMQPKYVPGPRAAASLAWGVVLLVLAVPLLGASAYAGLAVPRDSVQVDNPSVFLAWAGWILLAGAAVTLGIGVFRLAERLESRR